MAQWLASHLEVFALLIAALVGGEIGLNQRRGRRLKECKLVCAKQVKTIIRLRRDYKLSLEYNFQDRYTIRKLAVMVRDYETRLNIPPRDILLALYDDSDNETLARRMTAQQDSLHRTYPTGVEDGFENSEDGGA
jgi:hypothetical protein